MNGLMYKEATRGERSRSIVIPTAVEKYFKFDFNK